MLFSNRTRSPIFLNFRSLVSSGQCSLCLTWCRYVTNSRSLPKLMSIESVMPSSHLILCGPFLPPSVSPNIKLFSSESGLRMRWLKYWSLSFNISPSNEYSGLISFRMDWLGSPCSTRDSQESSPTPQSNCRLKDGLAFSFILNI